MKVWDARLFTKNWLDHLL